MKKILLASAFAIQAITLMGQDKTEERLHFPGPQGGPGGYFGNQYSPPAMSYDEYARACAAIDGRAFDDDRKTVAQQVAVGGRLSSEQVKGILALFSFESTRLAFAKFAYAYVVDPYNYWVVNEGFHFSSSIAELETHRSMTAVSGQVVETYGSYGINHGASPYPGTFCGTGSVGVNGYYGHPGIVIMAESDLDRLLLSLNDRHFDSDRLRLAKQGVGRRHLSAYMVKRVMEVFDFDDSRLAFAKFAYDKCFDRHNYYLVNDAFTFGSSVRELDKYIRHQG